MTDLWHCDCEDEVPRISARDLFGASNAHQLPIDDDPDPVAEHLGLLHAMRREDEGTALLIVLHNLPETTTARRI